MKNDATRQAWWDYHCAVADLGPDHPETQSKLRRLHLVDPASRPRRLPAPTTILLVAA